MKFLVCFIFTLLSVSVQSFSFPQIANRTKWTEECQAETEVSNEAIDQFVNNQFDAITDPKIKAHGLCFGKKIGFITPSGDVATDAVKTDFVAAGMREEDTQKVISKCIIAKDTKEESAWESYKCLRKNYAKLHPNWNEERKNEWIRECQSQTGVSEEEIRERARTEFDGFTDQKMKNFVYCFAKKGLLINDSGDISEDVLKNELRRVRINEKHINVIINKCVAKEGDDVEKIFQTMKCTFKNLRPK